METTKKQTKNLVPNSKRTAEQLREMGRRGGAKSGEARREKKALREYVAVALETVVRDENGAAVKSPDDPRRNLTRKEAGAIELALRFAAGDLKAIDTAVKILGEYETKACISIDTSSPAERLAALINEARKK